MEPEGSLPCSQEPATGPYPELVESSSYPHPASVASILILYSQLILTSWDSAVGIATSYWLDDRGVGVRVPVGSRIFTSPCRSDRLWGPSSLLSNGYRGFFIGGKAAGAWS
jgi:hypothetical protein